MNSNNVIMLDNVRSMMAVMLLLLLLLPRGML